MANIERQLPFIALFIAFYRQLFPFTVLSASSQRAHSKSNHETLDRASSRVSATELCARHSLCTFNCFALCNNRHEPLRANLDNYRTVLCSEIFGFLWLL